jgi:hypothetical protein
MNAKRLALRLFLEGIEVPCSSAGVQGGDAQPASATIQIIATDDVHSLEAGTLVHLFTLDLYPDPGVIDAIQRADTVGYQGLTPEMLTLIGEGYRLLFVGEFMQLGFQRSASGRSVTLQCLDMSSYWDKAKQYYMSGPIENDDGTLSKVALAAAFMGAGAVSAPEADDVDGQSAAQGLVDLLTSKSATCPTADGALAGVLRLLESIGGVYRGNSRFHGLNDVLSAAELRLRLSQMIGIPSGDTTSKALLNHLTFRKWLKATLSRNKGVISFREILELVLGRVYHTHVSVLAPPLRPGRMGTLMVRVTSRGGRATSKDPNVQARMDALKAVIDANGEDGTVEGLRQAIKDAAVPWVAAEETMSAIDQTDYATNATNSRLSMATGHDRTMQENLQAANENLDGADLDGLVELSKETYRLYSNGAGGGAGQVVKKDVYYSERLITNAIFPNVYFCAPPRCNVFFPDNYNSFDYSRSFMSEVTRLELTAQKEVELDSLSPDPATKIKYHAPNLDIGDSSLSSVAKKGIRVVMPHERFTGIIPNFQSVPDITAFQKIDVAQGGRGKIPYMQRVAAFNFFEMRFAPRVASIAGPYNPYPIAGLPALIIDQYKSDAVRQTLAINPTQYIGKIASISHSISQGGGTTAIQLTHCRSHDERMEYLGPFINSFWVPTGTKSTHVTKDAEMRPIDSAQGLASLPEATQTSTTAPGSTIPKSTITLGEAVPSVPNQSRETSSVTLGADSMVSGEGPTTSVEPDIDSPSEEAVTDAVKTLYAKRREEVSAEEALFPPWMSTIYTNERIGPDFYQDLFQIGSICDDVTPQVFDPDKGHTVGSYAEGKTDGAAAMSASQEAAKRGENDKAKQMKSGAHGVSVTDAVNALVAEYARLKESNGDFDSFYKAYAWRPIATLRQVLGAHDFDLSSLPEDAPLHIGQVLPKSANTPKAEGFHSRAFGPYDAMEYLNHPETPYSGSVEASKVNPAADPRGKRYRAVLAYAAVLKASRGLRG